LSVRFVVWKYMQIVEVNLSDLKPYNRNAKKHPENQVEHIANSLREFGWKQPIVIDKDNVIVCGHGRLLAAKSLGWDTAPCVYADDLTDEQIRAYRIIDNKSQEVSGWDYEKLDAELDKIMDAVDMTQYGFSFEYGEDLDEGEAPRMEIDNSEEIDITNYGNDTFECECPVCGFRF